MAQLARSLALQATVERKSLSDLVSSLTNGKLQFRLTELSALPRAAVVVEERYSQVFKLDHVRPSVVADGIAECQIRFPTVPIVFCETRAGQRAASPVGCCSQSPTIGLTLRPIDVSR